MKQAASQCRPLGLFLLALGAAACGGISVHHQESAEETGATGATGGTGTSSAGRGGSSGTSAPAADPEDPATCSEVCGSCLSGSVADCASFCGGLRADAVEAGCGAALGGLLACYARAGDTCDPAACPAENNALTACILDYCDRAPKAPLCVAPL